jgi:hypothetical protein
MELSQTMVRKYGLCSSSPPLPSERRESSSLFERRPWCFAYDLKDLLGRNGLSEIEERVRLDSSAGLGRAKDFHGTFAIRTLLTVVSVLV